jgi:hypothetical protein
MLLVQFERSCLARRSAESRQSEVVAVDLAGQLLDLSFALKPPRLIVVRLVGLEEGRTLVFKLITTQDGAQI